MCSSTSKKSVVNVIFFTNHYIIMVYGVGLGRMSVLYSLDSIIVIDVNDIIYTNGYNVGSMGRLKL